MTTPLTAEEIQAMLDASPFIAFMNLTVTSLDAAAGEITMRMPLRPEFERKAGTGRTRCKPSAANEIVNSTNDARAVPRMTMTRPGSAARTTEKTAAIHSPIAAANQPTMDQPRKRAATALSIRPAPCILAGKSYPARRHTSEGPNSCTSQ